jgi:hypothetical protein
VVTNEGWGENVTGMAEGAGRREERVVTGMGEVRSVINEKFHN